MNKVKKIIQEVGVISLSITIVFVLVMGISVVKGWTEPTAPAPGGNVAAPINVGSIGQIKQGNMILNSDGILTTGLTVNRDLKVINGAIDATGDICTDVGGGKCLGDASMDSSSVTFTYYCFTDTTYGTPRCINAGGDRKFCPNGYKQKIDLGSWGSCDYSCNTDSPLNLFFLPPGGECACNPGGVIMGNAYVCSS